VRADDDKGLSGTLAIGAGETPVFAAVARAAAALRAENPHLRISVTSGNGEQIDEAVREGVLDLALFVGPGRLPGYDYLVLPHVHRWGLYLRADSPLAARRAVAPRHLAGIPLVLLRQMFVSEFLSGWLGRDASTLNVAATYNLAYNALSLVAAGLGAAVCIDGVLPAVFARGLVFRPFRPALESDVYLAWKQGVPLTPAASALLARIRDPA
ncbi:MAG: LysR family transcriptional regulator substrate-binding protein, partial [Kiritimatiellae bacterium]|nr:LysR family transcriptional regulator substrate-binding protein [Kiritimatiellia bacterium]